jgi:hypothetical protein
LAKVYIVEHVAIKCDVYGGEDNVYQAIQGHEGPVSQLREGRRIIRDRAHQGAGYRRRMRKKAGRAMRKYLFVLCLPLFAILISGCVSEPVKESSINEGDSARYVQIDLLDGTQIGGKYVSETAAFTTIVVMYIMDTDAYTFDAYHRAVKDPEKYFVKGNGAEISFKNSLINTMVTIDNPTTMIEANLQEMNETAEAIRIAAETRAEEYRVAKEKRESSN